jgi:hypothetical protein
VTASPSPTRAGLRAVLRQPKIILAEVAWRWLFGGCSLLLAAALFVGVVGRVEVSDADYAALGAQDPFTIANALMSIFSGVWPALLRVGAILSPLVALLWMVAATLGRAATLQLIFAMPQRPPLGSLARLSLWRVVITIAALAGFFGAALLGAFLGTRRSAAQPDWVLYLATVFVLWPIVLVLWGWLTWVLSIAPIFAVRDGLSSARSIAATFAATRAHRGAFFAASTAYGFLRIFAIALAIVLSIMAAVVAGSSLKLALVLIAILTLGYFAVADFFYAARLASYAAIVEKPAAGESS